MSPMKRVPTGLYGDFVEDLSGLLESARLAAARSVNTVMTATYWEVGRRIVEYEQGGKDRAEYGTELLNRLSHDLTRQFGRGFSLRNLQQIRGFYVTYAAAGISQTVSAKFSQRFPLPWSHYVRLLRLDNPLARQFYEAEALRGGWTVRQLQRQIDSQYYERTALSKNKEATLSRPAPPDSPPTRAADEIRDPLVLEFLGLKDGR